ncbi:MAG: tetratricopeptide repeat protein [Acidobacteriaceae bacterium]|nr:tetratricopeptide repeat protein [Acidobacteriaceae bacterium]
MIAITAFARVALIAQTREPAQEQVRAAETYFSAGKRMFEAQQYPAAVKELAAAVRLNPALPGLQALYGEALLNTGDPDAASAAFETALTQDPHDFSSSLALGQILLARRNCRAALPLVESAAKLRPQSGEAKLALAEALAGTRQFEKARPYAEAAALAMPGSSEAHQALAAVYSGLHSATQASAERELASALAPPEAGPKVHYVAPDFALRDARSGEMVRLRDFGGRGPIVLVFGSYTCPNFRASAEVLKSMYERYKSRVQFLLIYIREAHSTDKWQSTRNEHDGVILPSATTFEEKSEHATLCSRTLHLPFRALVDGMDGEVEREYNAWPSRAFVIGTDARVLYATRLTELDFHPDEMESVLRRALSAHWMKTANEIQ